MAVAGSVSGETIERNLLPAYALTVADLADTSALRAKLDAIRRDYAPARLALVRLEDSFKRTATVSPTIC